MISQVPIFIYVKLCLYIITYILLDIRFAYAIQIVRFGASSPQSIHTDVESFKV